MCLLLEADVSKINGELFNIGSAENNYQLGPLGEKIAKTVSELVGETVEVEWYGDPDHRSYSVSFEKIEKALNWKAQWNAEKGVKEIVEKLESGELEKNTQTLTLEWYKDLMKWHKIIKDAEMYGGILDI
jgi:nucleoside-diphosphate-sugar epimerase